MPNKIKYVKKEEVPFEFKLGMEIGLLDPILMDKESVEWYTIVKIEPLDGTYVGLLYLQSNQDANNIHTITSPETGMYTMYAELIETISDRIVLP